MNFIYDVRAETVVCNIPWQGIIVEMMDKRRKKILS